MKRCKSKQWINLLAFAFYKLALVGAEEKFAIEQLDGNYSENKLKQYVHNKNIYNVL